MAKTCCICGDKLSTFDSSSDFSTPGGLEGQVCDRCESALRMLARGRATMDGVEQYRLAIKGFEARVSKGGNRDIQQEMTAVANARLEALADKLDQQLSMDGRFPSEERHLFGDALMVNDCKKLFAVIDGNSMPIISYEYSDLVDYEVREDGETVTSSRAGSAAVGALLAGSAGAIVGSSMKKHSERVVEKLDIVLMLSDSDNPTFTIRLISGKTTRGSSLYQKATNRCDQIVSALKQIINENKREDPSRERPAKAIYAFSVADEILKFKQLMDSGIITSDEFEAQKHKLLSLDY